MGIRAEGAAVVGLLVVGLLGSPGWAQTGAGQVEDTLPRRDLRAEPPPEPIAPDEPETGDAPGTAPAAAEALKVVVRQFRYSGNTLLTGQTLDWLIRDYRNRPVTLAELYEATDILARAYRESGYTLTSVVLPPQRIDTGEVHIQIIEGRVSQIVVEGDTRLAPNRIKQYFEGSGEGAFYQGPTVNQALQQLNEIPGLSARAIVRPGSEFGTSELVLRTRERRYEGALSLDNFGRESTGESRLSGLLAVNNPLRLGDQLQLFGLVSEDALLRYGQLSYSLPLAQGGTRLISSLGYSEFEVSGPLDVRGDSLNARLGVIEPLRVNLRERLEVSAALTHGNSEGRVFDIVTSGADITLLELGAGYSLRHDSGTLTRFGATASTNFRELRREDLVPGMQDDGRQRLRIGLDLSHQRPLALGISGELRVQGVYSPDPLVDSQQFSVGGPGSVRGYPAAEIRGDRGYAASLSLSRPFTLGLSYLVPRLFADYGEVHREAADLRGVNERDSLTSVGLGADLHYRRALLRADVSFPTDNHVVAPGSDGRISNGRDSRLLTSLTVSF
jgi:hemolysin activation/secretion protein